MVVVLVDVVVVDVVVEVVGAVEAVGAGVAVVVVVSVVPLHAATTSTSTVSMAPMCNRDFDFCDMNPPDCADAACPPTPATPKDTQSGLRDPEAERGR